MNEFNKSRIEDLAIFGGTSIFQIPKSTSNLIRPDFENFLGYSKLFFDQQQFTNNGPNVRLLEKRLADFHQTEFCITFCSGFWAIALTISAVAIKFRTEIIMPSLTYRRMADIAAWVNLKPHFCEVDSTTLAMSAKTVKPCINENTAIILGVHPIVNCCDVDGLLALSEETRIPLIFDSVESVYETVPRGKVGSIGKAEAFSLHACKLLNGFGGGYITTNDGNLARELSWMRGFGFKDVDKVEVSGGLNAKLNEIHAAMALASLDGVEAQVLRNKERYHTYKSLLQKIPGIKLVEFDETQHPGYKNIVVELTDSWPLKRLDTINILNAEKILARAYYSPPLHQKQMMFDYIPASLKDTERLSERFVNLPCGYFVSNDDIEIIVKVLEFILENSNAINDRLNLDGKVFK